MTGPEMEALFALADMARKEADAENGDDDYADDDDPCRFFENAPRRGVSRGRARCYPLSDGDFHMCFGLQCEHLTLDRERQLVCSITGMIVGVEHSRDYDAGWTGRSTGSANPDDTAGTPQGGWVRRRDMFSASVSAYRNAHSISDHEVVLPVVQRGANSESDIDPTTGIARPIVKRGALCVDEVPSDVPQKRQRAPRTQFSREALEKLAIEAMQVISALLIVELNDTVRDAPQTRKLDPRLQNLDFVRAVALRKYVRACAEVTPTRVRTPSAFLRSKIAALAGQASPEHERAARRLCVRKRIRPCSTRITGPTAAPAEKNHS